MADKEAFVRTIDTEKMNTGDTDMHLVGVGCAKGTWGSHSSRVLSPYGDLEMTLYRRCTVLNRVWKKCITFL